MAICLPDCKLREGKGKPLVGFTHHCILSAQHVPGTPTPHSPQIKQSSLILSPSLRSTPFLGHYLISGLSFLFVALFISSSWTYMVLTVIAVSLPAPPRTHTCKNRNSIFFPKKSLSSESQVWGYIPLNYKREKPRHIVSYKFIRPTTGKLLTGNLFCPFHCHCGHKLFSSSNDDFGTKYLWSEMPVPH